MARLIVRLCFRLADGAARVTSWQGHRKALLPSCEALARAASKLRRMAKHARFFLVAVKISAARAGSVAGQEMNGLRQNLGAQNRWQH